ncbi:MAG: SMC-Scp complex subunit ScpB [Anaerolineales bacterium]|nr:SMC-Scp complex subunit ScpB [Anaerolineales bacterium]
MTDDFIRSESDEQNLELDAKIEALLFVSPSPVTIGQLAAALDETNYLVQKGLEQLALRYENSGIQIQEHQNKFMLTTAPSAANYVEKFLDLEATSRLSKAALETLAVVAYQEPVTRPMIDSIRGVSSDGVIRNLLSKGLIEEAGRSEGPGRPILYATTADFLKHFGMSSTDELPELAVDISRFTSDEPISLDSQPRLLKD